MVSITQGDDPVAHEGHAAVEEGSLYYRQVGQGRPIIVLHGGADLDHTYLLPDMDRLADSYRLIYYDQRGRGRSVGDVQAISLQTELEDLHSLREHLGLDSVAVLGHSWGGLLAMAYAIRHPNRVSHMILMNTCVASHEDFKLFDEERQKRLSVHEDKRKALRSSAKYKEGDPETFAEAYRLYMSVTIKDPEHVHRMNLDPENFTNEGILRARKIEERLFNETVLNPEFDLIPDLKRITAPTLIIHGDYDFIPLQTVSHIAGAIQGAQVVLLEECGHISYLEAPDGVRRAMADFFGGD